MGVQNTNSWRKWWTGNHSQCKKGRLKRYLWLVHTIAGLYPLRNNMPYSWWAEMCVRQCFLTDSAHQQIIHSVEYKSTVRRDNSLVDFNGNGFGPIQCFITIKTRWNKFSFYALLNVMEKCDNILWSTSDRHMVAWRPSCGQLRAIKVKDITNICVCAQANDKFWVFWCVFFYHSKQGEGIDYNNSTYM